MRRAARSASPRKARRAVPRAAAGLVVVITAGTGDLPVAEEAVETARWMGCDVDSIVDVGVAGPQRLIAQKPRFERADAIVVVAGMEARTTVGCRRTRGLSGDRRSDQHRLRASFGGLAALLGMLNSCAANVTVVNIDAGFMEASSPASSPKKFAASRVAVRKDANPYSGNSYVKLQMPCPIHSTLPADI